VAESKPLQISTYLRMVRVSTPLLLIIFASLTCHIGRELLNILRLTWYHQHNELIGKSRQLRLLMSNYSLDFGLRDLELDGFRSHERVDMLQLRETDKFRFYI
jgi:hypothetical protein